MRFIKIAHCWQEEDGKVYSTDLRIHPFSIEAYHACILDYMEDGIPMSRDTTKIITKSGQAYDLLLEIGEFEKLLSKYMAE